MVAIWFKSALALPTELPISCSTLERSDWMPCDVVFNCCASDCAADSAEIWADWLPELADSACNAVVKLLNDVSTVRLGASARCRGSRNGAQGDEDVVG